MGKIYNGHSGYLEDGGRLLAEVNEFGYVSIYSSVPGGNSDGRIIGKVDFLRRRVYIGYKGELDYGENDLLGGYDSSGYVYAENDSYWLRNNLSCGFVSANCVGKVDSFGNVTDSEYAYHTVATCKDPLSRISDAAAFLLLVFPLLNGSSGSSYKTPNNINQGDNNINQEEKKGYISYRVPMARASGGMLGAMVDISILGYLVLPLIWIFGFLFLLIFVNDASSVQILNSKLNFLVNIGHIHLVIGIASFCQSNIKIENQWLRKLTGSRFIGCIFFSFLGTLIYFGICKFGTNFIVKILTGRYRDYWVGIDTLNALVTGIAISFMLSFGILFEYPIYNRKKEEKMPTEEESNKTLKVYKTIGGLLAGLVFSEMFLRWFLLS